MDRIIDFLIGFSDTIIVIKAGTALDAKCVIGFVPPPFSTERLEYYLLIVERD